MTKLMKKITQVLSTWRYTIIGAVMGAVTGGGIGAYLLWIGSPAMSGSASFLVGTIFGAAGVLADMSRWILEEGKDDDTDA